MTARAARPLPEELIALVRDYGEHEYVSGSEIERVFLRQRFGLGVPADSDESILAARKRVERKREELLAAIQRQL